MFSVPALSRYRESPRWQFPTRDRYSPIPGVSRRGDNTYRSGDKADTDTRVSFGDNPQSAESTGRRTRVVTSQCSACGPGTCNCDVNWFIARAAGTCRTSWRRKWDKSLPDLRHAPLFVDALPRAAVTTVNDSGRL